jgi:pantothenate kinase-related protein Tda10
MFSLVVLGFYLLSICASALNSIATIEHEVNVKLSKIEKVFDKIDAFIDLSSEQCLQ